jgi:hypothetical protein
MLSPLTSLCYRQRCACLAVKDVVVAALTPNNDELSAKPTQLG